MRNIPTVVLTSFEDHNLITPCRIYVTSFDDTAQQTPLLLLRTHTRQAKQVLPLFQNVFCLFLVFSFESLPVATTTVSYFTILHQDTMMLQRSPGPSSRTLPG